MRKPPGQSPRGGFQDGPLKNRSNKSRLELKTKTKV